MAWPPDGSARRQRHREVGGAEADPGAAPAGRGDHPHQWRGDRHDDPLTARTVISEIVKLRDLERVTPLVVTHQLPDAFYIASHEAVPAVGGPVIVPSPGTAELSDVILLKDAGTYFKGTVAVLRGATEPYLRRFLTGWIPRLV